MTVNSIMNTTPLTIPPEATFGEAVQTLIERRVRNLPVVDATGIYRGMFDLYDIWKQLLPRAVLLQDKFLEDLSFFSGSLSDLKQKLGSAAAKPLTEFLDDKQSPPVHPETPMEEVILLLFRHDGAIPVIEKNTRRFLGIVTAWEILNALR